MVFPVPQRISLSSDRVPASALQSVDEGIAPDEVTKAQGYRLVVGSDGVVLRGHDEAGLFYGRQTLAQLRDGAGETLPCLTIEDWPDLLVRGYMLDVSRDRVPTMATMKSLIDKLSQLKFNQLQIYTEHTIAYAGHEAVWKDASPITFAEFAELEAYCRERFIELVPCQNVFGHMERWLTQPEYEHLAETLDGWDTPWGFRNPAPNSLDPSDPASFALSADLIGQLATHSASPLLNIGCDETNDIGQGKSKARVEREGRAAVYLDYLKRLCAEVAKHGKTPMFWGDIVLDHPELIPQLPEDAVLLNWWYEADHDWMGQSKKFTEAGVRFYVCPGTSSWCTLTGRGQNAVDNCREAAEAGVAHGAEGMLITDWGDHGHWQPFVISWPGLIYGAGVGWALEANRSTADLPHWISRIGLDEPTDELGQIVWELSNVYAESVARISNATWWFHVYQWCTEPWTNHPRSQVSAEDVQRVTAAFARVEEALAAYEPSDEASALRKRELAWCVAIAQWAVARSPHAKAPGNHTGIRGDGRPTSAEAEVKALIETYRSLWLAGCRPGGLKDSVHKLRGVLRDDARA
ncbi:MAG: family 20 glycosylhydrolase [Planctomycetota bacterium]